MLAHGARGPHVMCSWLARNPFDELSENRSPRWLCLSVQTYLHSYGMCGYVIWLAPGSSGRIFSLQCYLRPNIEGKHGGGLAERNLCCTGIKPYLFGE